MLLHSDRAHFVSAKCLAICPIFRKKRTGRSLFSLTLSVRNESFEDAQTSLALNDIKIVLTSYDPVGLADAHTVAHLDENISAVPVLTRDKVRPCENIRRDTPHTERQQMAPLADRLAALHEVLRKLSADYIRPAAPEPEHNPGVKTLDTVIHRRIAVDCLHDAGAQLTDIPSAFNSMIKGR